MTESSPFSFTFDGKPSPVLLKSWIRSETTGQVLPGREWHRITWNDPHTGLQVAQEVTLFTDYPAVEWVLRLTNTGPADSPVIEDIRPLDLHMAAPSGGDVVLHHAHGSTCAPTDFLPLETKVEPKADLTFAPNGGRSSDGHLPFFSLAWPGGGLIGAIGWSGQWVARLQRDEGGGLHWRAGLQFARFKLQPGESVRTPRILLVGWQGSEWIRGNNLLRRLLLAHYVPRINGEITIPPITQNTWFTYKSGNGVTQANQLAVIAQMAPLGIEGYWLDAGWFEGGWPAGAGSWVPRTDAFPHGLKVLGDAARKQGLGFVLWFEPERVNPASRIAKEHPEWVLHAGPGDGLFNLGDPAAREWLTNHLSKCIADWGITVYRNDFNIDPLRFWKAADTPERQGIAEIRYIDGLYRMWDELRERHPGVALDDCASGGRRIDLELISRSFPLTRSDTPGAGKPLETQDQVQTAGLSLYVPLHASLVWSFEPYAWRSVATMGSGICQNTLAPGFDADRARRSIAETKMLRPLQLGDYYPLLDINLDERQWCAWQFDRPELGKGYALLFRRAKSPYAAVTVSLAGVEATRSYQVTFAYTGRKQLMSGIELQALRVDIDPAPGSALVLYERKDK